MLPGDIVHSDSADPGPPAGFFEITLPTRPVPIRIEYGAIGSLHAAVPSEDRSVGVLLGKHSREALTVDRCALLPPDAAISVNGFIEACSGYPPQSVVGFFRTQNGGWPEMQKTDRDIAQTCFQYSGSLFLLIQTPGRRPWSAAVFDLDRPTTKPAFEFVFDEYLLRNGYSTALAPSPEPEALPDPRRIIPQPYWIALGALGVLLLLGALTYQWWAGKNRSEPLSAGSPLALKVGRSGKDFELSWDRLAPALQQANSGSVTIHDGEITRTVTLSAAQLREGRLMYTPLFGDLNFRLEVQGARTEVESVQVFSWDAKMAYELLANLRSAPPGAAGPPPSAPPGPALPPPPNRIGSVQTPAVPSIPAPAKQPASIPSAPLRAPSAPSAEAPPPASGRENAPAKSVAATPPPSPVAVPTASLRPPDARPSITPAPSTDSEPAPGGIVSPPEKTPEKAAPLPNPVIPPAPNPSVPASFNNPVSAPVAELSRTQSPNSNLAPAIVQRVMPRITPDVKRSLNSHAGPVRLSVRVSIDTSGNVRKAEILASSGNSGFADIYVRSAALDAARQWKFRPGALNGKVVESESTIEFAFQ